MLKIKTLAMSLLMLTASVSLAHAEEPYVDIIGSEFESRIKLLQNDYELPKLRSDKLEDVNAYVNSFKYKGESLVDIWKSPNQFFADKSGDCEDFVIVKYHYLKHKHKVQMVVGKNRANGEHHAVLLVDDKYVLDNLIEKIRTYDDFLKKYTVDYRFSEKGLLEGGKKQ